MQQLKEILIIAPHPLILQEAGVSTFKNFSAWTERHYKEILTARTSIPLWRDHTIFLRTKEEYQQSTLLKSLEDLGYKKVFFVKFPHEYAVRGSMIDIFPVNRTLPVRIDFFSNSIEAIIELSLENTTALDSIDETITFDPALLKKLKDGDFVTHLDHGVGVYRGIKIDDNKKFLILEYAHGDMLYVPEDKIEKVTPYIGFHKPKITRLGGTLWFKTRKKAKDEILKLAKELLELYARRSIAKRPVYSSDHDLWDLFIQSFEYELTLGQHKAETAVEQDMERSTTPMERLVCGDVGFGKTEVGFRSAFRAILSGRQVALLAPTTVLADQHFTVARERFKNLPVTIELLSRGQTTLEQKNSIEKLSQGSIDLIIGTHRLLSNDVRFKNLGLVIIDEEQKFGVKQKEKFKSLKGSIDLLYLSATPIPRTLNLCLSGIKDVSIIEDPPLNRTAIETIVKPLSWPLIKQAIQSELDRKGQVFFLHNRIASIQKPLLQLRKYFPSARMAILHSKLSERTIIDIIHKFRAGEIDILIATTIIQNGLDLKNANTLIVEDSLHLGLADAHQLRGRVGRSDTRAFAYFFYSPRRMTQKSSQRLLYLQEYSSLGDGYQLALRDLELRGSGNILGKEQSGTINKIGFNLYYQILNQAVSKLKEHAIELKS